MEVMYGSSFTAFPRHSKEDIDKGMWGSLEKYLANTLKSQHIIAYITYWECELW